MNTSNGMYGLLMTGVESAAQMSIGQAVLRLIDRILWIVEKSVQWSLPTPEVESDENGKTFGKVELVRPLPWLLFLPSLLVLRIIRIGLDATGSLLGYPRVEPSDVVRVIQRGRRRIRAIKSSGLKSMRMKKFTIPTVKVTLTEEAIATDSAIGSPNQDSKRKYSELSSDDDTSEDESDNEPLISKIDRLANTSGSDKDFSIGDYSTTDESETSSSDTEANVSISPSEVQDLKAEKEEMEKTWCGNPECTQAMCDNELHKLTKCLEKLRKFNVQHTNGSQDYKEEEVKSETIPVAELEKVDPLTTNGVSNDRDAFYSPISWKSVSPEISIAHDKQDIQVDAEEKLGEEVNNGQVKNIEETKEDHDLDSKNQCMSGQPSEEHAVKEKQRTSSQSNSGGGGHNKNHHKHRRGNHGNRKKK